MRASEGRCCGTFNLYCIFQINCTRAVLLRIGMVGSGQAGKAFDGADNSEESIHSREGKLKGYVANAPSQIPLLSPRIIWWAVAGSNCGPPACKAGALTG